MVRVRPIGRPQLGHKCAELRIFPPVMPQILTSKTHRAVMVVTVERDFLRVRRPVCLAVLALNVLGRPLDQFSASKPRISPMLLLPEWLLYLVERIDTSHPHVGQVPLAEALKLIP